MFTILRMASLWVNLRQGGQPRASSIATIPRDQMSTFSSYSFRSMSSGAIHAGVPTLDLRLIISLVSCMANPKSAILTSPSRLMSILSLLRSRWSCRREWRLSSPLSISLSMQAMTGSGICMQQWQTRSTRAPPSMNSTNIKSDYLQQQVKKCLVRLCELHRFMTAISFLILWRVFSSLSLMMRQAQYFLSCSALSQVKNTLHMPPLPSYFLKTNYRAGFFSIKLTLLIMVQNQLVDSSWAYM